MSGKETRKLHRREALSRASLESARRRDGRNDQITQARGDLEAYADDAVAAQAAASAAVQIGFYSLANGASANSAHGRSGVPPMVFVQVSTDLLIWSVIASGTSFTVTVNSTQVTVTNNAGATYHVRVWIL